MTPAKIELLQNVGRLMRAHLHATKDVRQPCEVLALHRNHRERLTMKLKPKLVPYSSVVGGGLSLADESGRVRFIVAIMGSTDGITKEETAAIAGALAAGVAGGIDVVDR